jgi:hypothetical protein
MGDVSKIYQAALRRDRKFMTFRPARPKAFARAPSLENVLFTIIALVTAAALFYLTFRQAMLQWQFRIPFPLLGYVRHRFVS